MLSILIPFHNEEKNLSILKKELLKVCNSLKVQYELIFIDDGSIDNSFDELSKLQINPTGEKLKIIKHRKRMGKGKALMSGFKESAGDIIIFMDADLQDDPQDVPRFYEKLKEGFDLVNGWREQRKDSIAKTLPSFIFNTVLLKLFFRSKFHDINCGFKAMKREILQEIPLYGDNYRFLPVMAEQAGYKTGEVIVHHKPRKFGKSKYGFFRLLYGLFDTLTTYFVYKFSDKPLHFFGPIGLVLFGIGFIISIYLAITRIFFGMLLYRRPILLFAMLFIIVGVQVVMTGFIAELSVYLHKKNK